jgi:geranylgeranyl reductase family protein
VTDRAVPPVHQLDAGPLAGRDWEVVVVGAGPAGSIAAMQLAEAGRRVLLLDRHSFPREKVCGDGLIADALACLERRGLSEEVRAAAHELGTVSVFSPGGIELEVPGRFLTIKRRTFDHLLASAAVGRGAVFARGRVTEVDTSPDGSVSLTVLDADRPVRARAAVLATGADVSLLDRRGMVTRPDAHAIALRCYVRSTYPLTRLVVSYDRAIVPGYGWIFPLGDGEFNVGCGVFYRAGATGHVDLRRLYARFVAEVPIARDLLAGATSTTPLRGARLRCGLEGSVAHRAGPVIAVGEAVGATFPFTGEGIGKAMETGSLGAEVVDAFLSSGDPGALAALPQRLAELAPRYLGYRAAERWLSRPWLNDLVARRARASHFMRDVLCGILNETADPRRVFSVGGLVRSLFR